MLDFLTKVFMCIHMCTYNDFYMASKILLVDVELARLF